jgi:hypothetical protein
MNERSERGGRRPQRDEGHCGDDPLVDDLAIQPNPALSQAVDHDFGSGEVAHG